MYLNDTVKDGQLVCWKTKPSDYQFYFSFAPSVWTVTECSDIGERPAKKLEKKNKKIYAQATQRMWLPVVHIFLLHYLFSLTECPVYKSDLLNISDVGFFFKDKEWLRCCFEQKFHIFLSNFDC